MKNENVAFKIRIFEFVCALLVLLFCIAPGIGFLARGGILNGAWAVSFIAIPVCFIALLAFLIFHVKKRILIFSLSLLCVLVLLLSFCRVFFKFERMTVYEVRLPEGTAYEKGKLFSIAHLSEDFNYQTAPAAEYYSYSSEAAIFFDARATIEICQYEQEDYGKTKTQLNETYAFYSEPMTNSTSGALRQTQTDVDGYTFCIVSQEDAFSYPKRLFLIATNDQTCEIVIIHYKNDDLDYIESLSDFILNDCGFKHVR